MTDAIKKEYVIENLLRAISNLSYDLAETKADADLNLENVKYWRQIAASLYETAPKADHDFSDCRHCWALEEYETATKAWKERYGD